MELELSEITERKKSALNAFETVTKTIIADEIAGNNRAHIEEMEGRHKEALQAVRELEAKIKAQRIHITDTYGPYLGREFLQPEKLSELSRLIQSGTASNISEAIEMCKNS